MPRARLVALLLLALTVPLAAHPTPYSYIDIRTTPDAIEVSVVAHVFDLAHDLNIDPPEKLLDPAFAAARAGALATLLSPRFRITADGRALACHVSSAPAIVSSRQSVELRFDCPVASPAGVIGLQALMFAYDPAHQTFVNVYDGSGLAAQTILDGDHQTFDYFSGTRQGTLAVVRKFVVAGVHHILIGPDHLLFLVGLLLLGGSLRRLGLVVTAFTLAHSLTLSLAALNIVSPPARVIEPAIALSIVYVGADNLLAKEGRDVRAWIAFAFGFVHGFGFASVLREMDLPPRALGWSLFSFNLGVEIGQLSVVIVVASALAALRSRSAQTSRQLVLVGSLVVIAAGAYWFVQRVFFAGT
jgi:hydrogenase/urease accessory protein HupE